MKLKKALELSLKLNNKLLIKVDSLGYICLNDLAKFYPGKRLDHWLNNSSTKEFIKILDNFINYPGSRVVYEKSLKRKMGRNGGTYAHKLLAQKFAMWISPEFELEVIRAYESGTQRKKDWNIKRILAANNFKLLCETIDKSGENERMHGHGYSTFAKMINKIIFGKSTKGEDVRAGATEKNLEMISYLEGHARTYLMDGMEYKELKKKLEIKYRQELEDYNKE